MRGSGKASGNVAVDRQSYAQVFATAAILPTARGPVGRATVISVAMLGGGASAAAYYLDRSAECDLAGYYTGLLGASMRSFTRRIYDSFILAVSRSPTLLSGGMPQNDREWCSMVTLVPLRSDSKE